MGHLGPTWYQGDTDAPEGVVYHYTNNHALRAILASGLLKPHRTMPGDRVPLVWASSNGIWEPASGRGLAWNPAQPIPFDTLSQLHGGLARLALDAAACPLTWRDMRPLLDRQWLASLQGPAGGWVRANSPRWFGTTHPVGRDFWVAVEVWKAPRWRDMPYSWEA